MTLIALAGGDATSVIKLLALDAMILYNGVQELAAIISRAATTRFLGGFTNRTRYDPPAMSDPVWDYIRDLRTAYQRTRGEQLLPTNQPVRMNGKPVYGSCDPKTGRISLYDGADEVTIAEELLHWEDLPRLERIIKNDEQLGAAWWNNAINNQNSPDWRNLYLIAEARVRKAMIQLGFKPKP